MGGERSAVGAGARGVTPLPRDRPTPWALAACGAFLLLNFGLRGGLPFVRFPAFAFPDTGGVMAVPLFRADGESASAEAFTDFSGVEGAAVDMEHPGLPTVVAHRFYEVRAWIDGHRGAGGDVSVEVGLRVLRSGPDGAITIEDQVNGHGTARRR